MKLEVGDYSKEQAVLLYRKLSEHCYESKIIYMDKRTSTVVQLQTVPVESVNEYSSVVLSCCKMATELKKYSKATKSLVNMLVEKYNDLHQLSLF